MAHDPNEREPGSEDDTHSRPVADDEGRRSRPFRGRGVGVEQFVYGTVVLLTVLAVATDDPVPDFSEVYTLIVGPLAATFLAHLLASMLEDINAEQHLPSFRRFGHLTAHAAQYLVIAVGGVAIVGVVAVTRLGSPTGAVEIVIDIGLLGLVIAGGVGAWRAVHRWWAVLLGAALSGVLGLAVIVLRVALEDEAPILLTR